MAGAFLPSNMPMQARRYAGRRIDLDLKDADVHDVFRTLAKVGRVNIVAADNVHSCRVLEKAGFLRIGEEIEKLIYQRQPPPRAR